MMLSDPPAPPPVGLPTLPHGNPPALHPAAGTRRPLRARQTSRADARDGRTGPALCDRLEAALSAAEPGAALATLAVDDPQPRDRADRFRTLLCVYDLHTAPLPSLGERVRLATHPVVADLKTRLEAVWLGELEALDLPDGLPIDALGGMRALAARDRLPAAYRWLAKDASWSQLVHFLAVEGGPDGGFDDLVAVCQVGLSGTAKLELAQNYWDEMGGGDLRLVHTTMYEEMAAAIGMPRIPRAEQPAEALERVALGGLFATNRWLQPEMLGALGLLELQAGPRCRLVLQAFDRLEAPSTAYPFYVEHADVDPRHGRDWLEKAVGPLCAEQPEWAPRVVRGAWWRSATNRALFDLLHDQLGQDAPAARRGSSGTAA